MTQELVALMKRKAADDIPATPAQVLALCEAFEDTAGTIWKSLLKDLVAALHAAQRTPSDDGWRYFYLAVPPAGFDWPEHWGADKAATLAFEAAEKAVAE